ncbi:hypothetical protein [Paenibacillus sp. FSL H7-0331]|uniref:hypothetical protein n=1 Tax=Paenibacillus sp. FSL H7-0331 TaxID=1920421 RepID=UPI00096F1135|nr:hypothetical protein [Paenibacillus sp. FSL H7-0331]OME98788.1 hypothetical protein BK127_39490 [Paenibacillus sp. FSL H7-0331]
MWTPDDYFEQIYRETIDEHKETASKESAERRREQIKSALRAAIGDFLCLPMPLNLEVLFREECGDYIRYIGCEVETVHQER